MKLLGATNHIVTMHETCLILQANHLPLVVTMTAEPDADAEKLIDLLNVLQAVLEPTREVIAKETEKF